MRTAQEVIKKLQLEPLPGEGGYFKRTYQHAISVPARQVGIDDNGDRLLSTAIYYLVVPESFSALHKVKSDEMFHFYSGDPVEMIQIDPAGKLIEIVLGPDIFAGQVPQVIVPKNVWQGTRLIGGGKWALLGTTVTPGFEYVDFELGGREDMLARFPQHRDQIEKFSRRSGEKTHLNC